MQQTNKESQLAIPGQLKLPLEDGTKDKFLITWNTGLKWSRWL